MKEIKFRGFNKYKEQYVYGSFYKEEGDCFIISRLYDNCYVENDMLISEQLSNVVGYKVIPESVGQYTGQEDKDGNEIYCGDIIYDTDNKFYTEIIFKNGCYCYEHDELTWYAYNWHIEVIKVVGTIYGTIYQNLELIK